MVTPTGQVVVTEPPPYFYTSLRDAVFCRFIEDLIYERDYCQKNDQSQHGAATGVSRSGDHESGGKDKPCHSKDKSGDNKGRDGKDGQKVDQHQSGSNQNDTSQSATSSATSEQKNVFVPIAFLSPCSNSGDVKQTNSSENQASSENDNNTEQEGLQDQRGETA